MKVIPSNKDLLAVRKYMDHHTHISVIEMRGIETGSPSNTISLGPRPTSIPNTHDQISKISSNI